MSTFILLWGMKCHSLIGKLQTSYEGGKKEITRHMEQSLAFIVTLVKLQPIKKITLVTNSDHPRANQWEESDG